MKKCEYPDKKCPNMETQGRYRGQCLLRNPFNCPMGEQDELLLTEQDLVFEISKVLTRINVSKFSKVDFTKEAKAILAKVKQRYEQEMKKVFKEIEIACGKCPDEPFGKLPASMFWQSLKNKYLKR